MLDRSRFPLYTGLLLVLLTVAAFLPALENGFIRFDDPLYVTENKHVRQGLTLEGIVWAFGANVVSNWHPLTLLSHMLDCEIFGLNPRGHHLTSLLLHAANVLLLFEVLRRMTGSLGRSALVAALFAIHPLRVESVAWVAERKDVLSGLFWILTMDAYLRYVRGPSPRRMALVALTLALGLMSKPMVVTLPFALLLLDVWPLRRIDASASLREQGRRLLGLMREKLPLFALVAAGCVVTVFAQTRSLSPLRDFPLSKRLPNVALSYAAYLDKTVLPRDLAVFYPMPAEFPPARVAAAALLVLTLTALAALALRRAPYVPVGWFWYLGTLVPVIGLVQVGGQAFADRYTYLPSIGLYLIAVWGVPDLLGRLKSPGARRLALSAATAAALIAVAVLTAATRAQLRHWRDSETLFKHTLAVTRDNYLAHLNLAQILSSRGERDEAMVHFREALRLRPGTVQVRAALGNNLRRWGRPAEALPHLRAAVRLRPQDGTLHHGLAMALEELGREDEAVAELRKAVELSPRLAAAHHGLGTLLQRQGRKDEALAAYLEALKHDPERTELYGQVALLLAGQGRIGDALPYFAEAARRRPDSARAHYNLALTLRSLGREEEARRHLTRAAELDPSLRP